jgi:hypothetical protein
VRQEAFLERSEGSDSGVPRPRFSVLLCNEEFRLNRPAHQTEVRSAREHVPVISPDIAFSSLMCGHQVHRVGGAQEEIGRRGNDQGTGSPQQGFVDWNELPQALLNVLVEAGGQRGYPGKRTEAVRSRRIWARSIPKPSPLMTCR